VAGVLLALIVAIGLIGLLVYVIASQDRYATMSEEEFEEEARKKSMLGAAITGMESALRTREAGYVLEVKNKIEREATPSPGEPPEEEGGAPSKKH
jgi:ABC-type bacteriocin/lantibiotic exporter with double-glycine peptidase domain